MTKKGENIYKRKDARWEGRYIKGRTARNKIIYGSVYGKTYQETKYKLILIKAKHIESNQLVNPYFGTFSDWLTYWFAIKVRHEVKKTTYSSYYRIATLYILPTIGQYPLKKVSPAVLQSFVYLLQEKQLSSGTIFNIMSLVKNCLKEAQLSGYITDNPCQNVVLPKYSKKETRVLTHQQQKKLETVALKEVGCSPVILALYSGMRVGEISGLKWSDIDFKNNLIHIRRTVSRIINENSYKTKTKLVEGTPKSVNSIRQIPLAKNLKNYLEQKKANAVSDYVVSSGRNLAEPRAITYRFKKSLKQAGVQDTNFHVLRHTFATRCLEQGIDIASLSKILGHQSTKMTLDTYTGSLLETRRNAMRKIDQLFKQ